MFKFFWVGEKVDVAVLDEEIIEDKDLEEEIWQVALDILETAKELFIIAPIAGIELEEIDLSFDNNILTIKWDRKKPEIYLDNVVIKNSECFWWNFIRNIILPDNLDFDSIKATLENNLLVITLQKLQFSSKKIEIDRIDQWEFI